MQGTHLPEIINKAHELCWNTQTEGLLVGTIRHQAHCAYIAFCAGNNQ